MIVRERGDRSDSDTSKNQHHYRQKLRKGKTRYSPLHRAAGDLILEYLEELGIVMIWQDLSSGLSATIEQRYPARAITADMVYQLVRSYSTALELR